MAKVLEDVRVLDFTRMYAGPFCTMLLKELGAEVIKVEFAEGGDAVRTFAPVTEGKESYIFIILNRGKKSITLNLRSERGREIAKELVKEVDILAENFSPGVMDKLGLGYEELKGINPRLIYASLSGFGHKGPRHSQPAYDLIAQAWGGMMSVTGFPDNPPTRTGPATADFMGALYTTISILAALRHREKTGEGQAIDISLQDCIWATTAVEYAPPYFQSGEIPKRLGNELWNTVPWGTYQAKDGQYIAIPMVTVGQWESFLRVMGREDLINDPKYGLTTRERIEHRDEINALVSEWIKARTATEVIDTLSGAGLPCSIVPTFDQVANDPQLLSREMIIEIEQLISGKLKVPGSVFKLSQTPGDATLPAPFLGQHNREVYSEILNYDEEKISSLLAKGII